MSFKIFITFMVLGGSSRALSSQCFRHSKSGGSYRARSHDRISTMGLDLQAGLEHFSGFKILACP
jgi:hypothetical protein